MLNRELVHQKGIMNSKYKEYLKSKEWLGLRLDILTVRGSKCELCGIKSRYLQVHHITYKNIFNEQPGDLLVLCGGCHKAQHPELNKNKKRHKKKRLTLHQKVQRKKKLRKIKLAKKYKY